MTKFSEPVTKKDTQLALKNTEKNTDLIDEFEVEKPLIIRVKEAILDKCDFRNNEIRQVLEFKALGDSQWADFEHEHLNSLWIDFQLNNDFKGKEKPSDKLLEKLLFSRFIPKYHALKSYFDSLKWDGKDHITQLCDSVEITPIVLNLESALPTFWKPLFTRWLISTVACGVGKSVNQVMLLFVGSQGTYKTTWMNRLCPPSLDQYIFTGHINPELTDNTTADFLAEKFIINIDDHLQTLFDRDFNKVKGIITATSITNRKAYRRDIKKRPRIASFCGSVNKEKIFQDIENRRYLTFKVDSIDIQKKINYDQVWAQVYHLFANGERYWFDSTEINQLNLINNHFALVSQEEEWLIKLYESVKPEELDAKFVMASEIVSVLSKASGLRLSPYKVSLAMKRLEWNDTVSKRIGSAKEPRKVYAVLENFTKDTFGNIKCSD
jgi:predicted P-loop ATPase